MTTTTDARRRGRYERVTDPSGERYLLHAVPSGYLDFSVYVAQGPVEALVQTIGAKIVNRLLFRGGWTLLAWRSDLYAPNGNASTGNASRARRRRRPPSSGWPTRSAERAG